jgi:hypothetical protein
MIVARLLIQTSICMVVTSIMPRLACQPKLGRALQPVRFRPAPNGLAPLLRPTACRSSRVAWISPLHRLVKKLLQAGRPLLRVGCRPNSHRCPHLHQLGLLPDYSMAFGSPSIVLMALLPGRRPAWHMQLLPLSLNHEIFMMHSVLFTGKKQWILSTLPCSKMAPGLLFHHGQV